MNRTQPKTLDDLPDVPFEKVLSYLHLEDRLRLSAVSRSCHRAIEGFRVSSLCSSSLPSGFIYAKNRWLSGKFACNFISSTRLETFFNAFGRSILVNLKQLCLCDLNLNIQNRTAFIRALNSFGQLEQLDIVRVECDRQRTFEVDLPMLISIRLEEVSLNGKLTLRAPRLQKVKFADCFLELVLVHGESVQSLLISNMDDIPVANLKNLEHLHCGHISEIDATLLSGLEKLKEVHLGIVSHSSILQIFEQKRQYRRTDLKIYLCGLLLNGPDDPAVHALCLPGYLGSHTLFWLVKNPQRIADEVSLFRYFCYYEYSHFAPALEIDLMKRFTDLSELSVCSPIRDIQRFLELLRNLDCLVVLRFTCGQPQQLLDGLPEYCAVQWLTILGRPSDVRFLLRLNNLNHLEISLSPDTELIGNVLDELPFLALFAFPFFGKRAEIEIGHHKQFSVSVGEKKTTVLNRDAVIQFFMETNEFCIEKKHKKQKVEELMQ